MENILNQNISFSLGTVLSVSAILILGNLFLYLLSKYFTYDKKIWKHELSILEEQKKDFNNIIDKRVKEQVKKYQLEAKIHKLDGVFNAIESLRRNTPEYSHQTKYFQEVNPNLLDLDKKQFDDMVEHVIGLLRYVKENKNIKITDDIIEINKEVYFKKLKDFVDGASIIAKVINEDNREYAGFSFERFTSGIQVAVLSIGLGDEDKDVTELHEYVNELLREIDPNNERFK